jgi:ABC-type sugar transport system ATPase subunit
MRKPILSASGISKRYPGVQALAGVSLDLDGGEIHALVGENGAGKSTLIRILAGGDRPDAGTVRVDGEVVSLVSPGQARRIGIAVIFQELSLVPWRSVAENVYLGREPGRGGFMNRREMESAARAILDELDVGVDVRAAVASLSAGERQLVEIARALSAHARVLIMDEPTSSLPASDAARLLRLVEKLRDAGAAVLFVSHRLEEVQAIAARVTVLRGGRVVATLSAAKASTDRLIHYMVGRSVDELFPTVDARPAGPVLLEVSDLSSPGRFDDVSFSVRAGEVVGFAGLIGAGRTEVMRAVAGIDHFSEGAVSFEGKAMRFRRPADAVKRGIVYVPEDRKSLGLVLGLTGRENLVLPTLKRYERFGVIRFRTIAEAAARIASDLAVRGRIDRPARTLSGGNQQKLVLGKWLLAGARLLILDEPTRGIDIGAKAEIYRLVKQLCSEGMGVILVSSELPELTRLSDRIVVMSGGRVQSVLARGEFDEQRILRAAFAAHTVRHVQEAA